MLDGVDIAVDHSFRADAASETRSDGHCEMGSNLLGVPSARCSHISELLQTRPAAVRSAPRTEARAMAE